MSINEGQTIQYTVVTSKVTDGTVLYWTAIGNVTNPQIVGSNTGMITITNNRSVFNVALANDNITDGTRTIGISLSTGSLSGPVVTTTANLITINDTSLSPVNRMWTWGNNVQGQLGQNDQINKSSPVQVGTDTSWSSINTGNYVIAGIKSNGTLWTWGFNTSGLGSLGQNDKINRSSPTQVGTLTNWASIAGNVSAQVATKTDGTLWSWGTGYLGSSAQNDQAYRSSPTQVGALTTWKLATQGNYNGAAVKTDGTLWTWGKNNYGQLGSNDTVYRSSPIQVGSMTNWSIPYAGYFNAYVIKTDGTLWSIGGWNPFGNSGTNNTVSTSSPVQIGSLTNWSSLAVGEGNVVAVKTNGTLWAWGQAYAGTLGTSSSSSINISSPVQVGSDTNWNSCAAKNYSVAAIRSNNTLWTWGANDVGQLGDGTTIMRSSPTQVGALTSWKSVSIGATTIALEGS